MSHSGIFDCSTVRELRADTDALSWLSELEFILDLPPHESGVYFLDAEIQVIRDARAHFDKTIGFTAEQRATLKRLVEMSRRSHYEHEFVKK